MGHVAFLSDCVCVWGGRVTKYCEISVTFTMALSDMASVKLTQKSKTICLNSGNMDHTSYTTFCFLKNVFYITPVVSIDCVWLHETGFWEMLEDISAIWRLLEALAVVPMPCNCLLVKHLVCPDRSSTLVLQSSLRGLTSAGAWTWPI